ncbi:molecular chaperone DnaJ [Klebsiella michiganensis]|uniref:molecular chaperone DnaJ n=1 Tax=Klebsiella michiganensis TaxID=1134687 RepID=UPI00224DE91A|nr:molecular chaperone DnaJ [Klebsiella michiganensis]MCX3082481.1 molecular chaperone DnaJ [Klebsiella michiganensis]MCY0822566.1 molecular chaperone DnaJ [Klebsiella michiganensis]
MSEIICPVCRGDGEAEYDCRDCNGTGYDPTEDNAFGQCHTCYGEGTTVQECFKCRGSGVIYQNNDNDEALDADGDNENEEGRKNDDD